MAFPQTPLDVLVELFVSGAWTTITADVYARDGIHISRGRADEGQRVDPGKCTLTLNNRLGKYSPRNPLSPYFGTIGRNTPVRVSVMAGTPFLQLPGAVGDHVSTPDAAALDITGDIDVRADVQLTNWFDAADSLASTEITGKLSGTTEKSWAFAVRSNRLYFEWSPDGTSAPSASSTVAPPVPATGRLAVRATLDVNNGAGGRTITFYTAPSGTAGPWTQLGSPVVQAGTTSIFNSTAPVRVGDATTVTMTPAAGRCYALEIRNGIGGTVVANPDFTAQTAGAGSFADGAGRTWTLNGQTSITNRRVRFVGEISAWPSRWDVSGKDVWVPVEAAGILRRLGQGAKALDSTLRRRIPGFGPLAYWPMEDGQSATQAYSPIPGVRPLRAAPMEWAAVDTLASSLALPTVNSDATPTVMLGRIPASPTPPTSWLVQYLFRLDTVNATVRTIMRVLSTGTVAEWNIMISGTISRILARDSDGATVFSQDVATGTELYNQWIAVQLKASQVGGNVEWQIIWTDVGGDAGAFFTSFAGTIGRPTGMASPADGYSADVDGLALGHISAWNAWSTATVSAYAGAVDAWAGETTGTRLRRLASEEGLTLSVLGDRFTEEQVGPQHPDTLLELLGQAADVDGGILYEDRERVGLVYCDRATMENQAVALALDYTSPGHIAPPLEPVDDDQGVRNDVTVQRDGGSSARVVEDTGPLSTQAPPNGVGVYDESVTLNLYSDAQPPQHAGWRLHMGTWDEARYPVLNLDLAAAPSLIDAVTQVDSGSRATIANPPAWLPPGPIDLIVQGYEEIIGHPNHWNLQLNCTPAGPWRVAVYDADRYDTSGSQLAVAVGTTDTTLNLITTQGPRWTSRVDDTPFDLAVGGETVTVTAPGSLLNSNAFFDTDASGWTAQNAAIVRSTAVLPSDPRALGVLRITPDGINAVGGALCALTATGTIVVGAQYIASMWVYSPAGWSDIQPAINWYTSASAFISTSSGSARVIPAGVWTYVEQTFTAPATASRAEARARHSGTPTAGDIYYVWGARVTRPSASFLRDGFGRTTASSWGTSDSGTAWNTVGGGSASDYSTNGTYAVQVLATVDTSRRTAVTAVHADFDLYCDITASAAATGDSLYGAATARMLDANNMYMARVEFTTGGAAILTVRKSVAGVQTQIGSSYTLPSGYAPGTFVRVRFQGQGSMLQAKMWLASALEPNRWHTGGTDTAITAANQIGTRSIRVTGNTNAASVEIRYDTFDVVNPQIFTAVRSRNGIVKSQAAGTGAALNSPAIRAM